METSNDTISKQIKYFRNKFSMTQAQLADKLDVSKQTISNWETGIKLPRMGAIQRMSDIFGVPKSTIIEGINADKIDNKQHITRIPILGEIACGDPITAEENIEGYLDEPTVSLPSGTLFYLRAKGHSMEPTIPDGSNVLIREQPEVEDDEIAAVLVNSDSEATLKRIKHQGNIIMLMPDNPSYSPYIVTKSNPARVLGKAIRFTTDL